MSTTDARLAGIVALLVILAGAVVLAVAPFDVGAIRLAGVSLLWWYAALLAPVAAALLAIAVLSRSAS